ncbi:MAG: hypothetical protein CME61_01210 [Halobacteriovoraceae bacterium]|nr:hypothetical protein [Halobacteriovoraceae bacterium]
MTNFDDDWKMTSSADVKSVEEFLSDTTPFEEDESIFSEEKNSLENQLSDWGISVPEVISNDEDSADPLDDDPQAGKASILDHLGTSIVGEAIDESLPSKDDLDYPDLEAMGIVNSAPKNQTGSESLDDDFAEDGIEIKNDSMSKESLEVTSVDDPSLPNENDLEYPDIDQIIAETSSEHSSEKNSTDRRAEDTESDEKAEDEYRPKSQLISLDELNTELDAMSGDDTDPTIEITKEIKSNLADELSKDVSADDFWATDDFPSISGGGDRSAEKELKIPSKDEVFKDILGDDDIEEEVPFKIKPSEKFASINLDDISNEPGASKKEPTSVNIDEVVDQVKKALEPEIEKIVKNLFSQKIEQVAWEVIPDLAENVIKKEVAEIAKQVYMETDKGSKK